MNVIDANSKISTILKAHPEALEVIVGISPKFNKLRNPLLRKLVASRATVAMACGLGGCTVEFFLKQLEPLGFKVNFTTEELSLERDIELPDFMKQTSAENFIELDVRSEIESGNDPLKLILGKTKQLKLKQVMKLVNSFEPIPLIQLLSKQGYETYTEIINENLVNTYFYKRADVDVQESAPLKKEVDWDEILDHYENKIKIIDVRELEMPLPMLTILESLDKLPKDYCLFVYHKRIPVFLLPELKTKKCDYRIREISENEVHILIFHT